MDANPPVTSTPTPKPPEAGRPINLNTLRCPHCGTVGKWEAVAHDHRCTACSRISRVIDMHIASVPPRPAATAEPPKGGTKSKREEQAALAAAIAAKRCVHCATVGQYGPVQNTVPIEGSTAKARYINCLACGRSNKVVV